VLVLLFKTMITVIMMSLLCGNQTSVVSLETKPKIQIERPLLSSKVSDYLTIKPMVQAEVAKPLPTKKQPKAKKKRKISVTVPKYPVSHSTIFVVTAYSPDPSENGGYSTTCTGAPLRKGIIATDPKVIPLGKEVYIPGYGKAVAADVGGAIKGNRIDVCLPSRASVRRWGRKKLKVQIL
jgi:3D (Asp-Asp-Asp) domain-containing protein